MIYYWIILFRNICGSSIFVNVRLIIWFFSLYDKIFLFSNWYNGNDIKSTSSAILINLDGNNASPSSEILKERERQRATAVTQCAKCYTPWRTDTELQTYSLIIEYSRYEFIWLDVNNTNINVELFYFLFIGCFTLFFH